MKKIKLELTWIDKDAHPKLEPRIKRLSEYLEQSYSEYLAERPGLILLMDEAHRYRASARIRARNELKPLPGLELTATPFTESKKEPVSISEISF